MNYNFFLVKIISKPEQSFFKEKKALTEVTVKYIPVSKKFNCVNARKMYLDFVESWHYLSSSN